MVGIRILALVTLVPKCRCIAAIRSLRRDRRHRGSSRLAPLTGGLSEGRGDFFELIAQAGFRFVYAVMLWSRTARDDHVS